MFQCTDEVTQTDSGATFTLGHVNPMSEIKSTISVSAASLVFYILFLVELVDDFLD